MTLAAISLLALISGTLIGAIGIGGVLLVPALSLFGIEVHAAVAAALASYIFSGAIATFLYARQGSIAWSSAGWLCLGAAPGAFIGAALASVAGSALLTALIAASVAFAGLRALLPGRGTGERGRRLGPASLAAIGGAIGLGSAVTGTGGPVLLMPLLIWLDLPLLMAIGLAQAIQLPIALVATAANLAYGAVDLRLAGLLSLGIVLGSWLGARAAHAMPLKLLTRLVGFVLIAVGALLLLRLSSSAI